MTLIFRIFLNFNVWCVMFFNRRRRRRSTSNQNQTEEMVFQEIRIEDKFKFEAQHGEYGQEINFNSNADQHNAVYWNTYALTLLLVTFVLLQSFVMLMCWACVKCNRSQSKRSTASVNEYASTVRNPISWDNSYYK